MTDRMRALLVAHGALIFLVGLAAGIPFAIEILQKFELWPLPFSIALDLPGDVRGWRMAHMEGILNGMMLFAFAGMVSILRYTPRSDMLTYWGLVIAAWANTVASVIGPLTETRGLAFGGFWNSIVYLLFFASIIGIVAAVFYTLFAALRAVKNMSQ